MYPGNLNGLIYNVSIYDESNKTSCVDLDLKNRKRIYHCERFYQYAAIPNQIGNTELETAMFYITHALSLMDKFMDMLVHDRCIKWLYQLTCLVVLPECLPEENKVVLPCQENCNDFLKGCVYILFMRQLNEKYMLNCDYLPSNQSNITCYGSDDICGPLPEINHGFIVEGNVPYAQVGDIIHHGCSDYTSLIGVPSSTCLPSGEWSKPPECTKGLHVVAKIVLIAVAVIFTALWISVIIYMCDCFQRRNKMCRNAVPLVNRSTAEDT